MLINSFHWYWTFTATKFSLFWLILQASFSLMEIPQSQRLSKTSDSDLLPFLYSSLSPTCLLLWCPALPWPLSRPEAELRPCLTVFYKGSERQSGLRTGSERLRGKGTEESFLDDAPAPREYMHLCCKPLTQKILLKSKPNSPLSSFSIGHKLFLTTDLWEFFQKAKWHNTVFTISQA